MIDFILRPFRRNFGKDKQFYVAIDDMFGFIPHNIELYKMALIHKSASIVLSDGQTINNERLEFLGDAVLESVSSDYLFIEYPDMNEGSLTKMRSRMVSRQTLNEVAKRIGLDKYVITHSTNNFSQKHVYGDAFEAMMGAIYLDQGYDFVNRLIINKIFVDYVKVDQLANAETDFKSRLIEWCQKNHHDIIFNTSNDKSYSSNHPFFYCKVLIDNIEMGYGAGESKKEAEQRAAYSVSQGFSDEDCTKLLDKLDMIESHSKPRKTAAEKHASSPKTEPKEVKAEVEAKPVKVQKNVDEQNPSEEVKPAPKRPRRARKPSANKGEAEVATDNTVEQNRQPKEVAKKSVVVEVAEPVEPIAPLAESEPAAKPVRKRSPRRKRESGESVGTQSFEAAAQQPAAEIVAAEGDEPAKPTVKRAASRRRQAKKRSVDAATIEDKKL